MANGGIIGPVQTVTSNTAVNRTTAFTSSGNFTAQAGTKEVDYLMVGGGGGTSTNPTSPRNATGGAGGSGHVVIREYANTIKTAPGVWSMNTVYEFVKDDNWTN